MAAAATENLSVVDVSETSKEEWLTKIVNLENQIQSLEREKSNYLFNRRNEFWSVFRGLEESDVKFLADRRNERQELKLAITRIRTRVITFRKMLTDMRPGPTFIEGLKKAMEDIEASIAAFKEKQQKIFEELLQEEKIVGIEVSAFERKLESWLASKSSQVFHNANPVALSTTHKAPPISSVPPAVLAFERFIQQTGGRQGGWDDYDHLTFIKIRTKFNGHPTYIKAAGNELPTKTQEEVREHDQWYSEYSALLESKRKAINMWKKHKQTARMNQLTSTASKTNEQTKKKDSSFKDLEREERQKKLKVWKAQQDSKHRKEEEKRLQLEIEKRKGAERERIKRSVLKAQVEEYARERENACQIEKEREEAERAEELERRKAATKEIERFRERDFKELELRNEKARMKEAENQEKMKALERIKQSVKIKTENDPNRLFKLTAGWEERKKAGVGSGIGGAVLSLPKRAVPSWRQGL